MKSKPQTRTCLPGCNSSATSIGGWENCKKRNYLALAALVSNYGIRTTCVRTFLFRAVVVVQLYRLPGYTYLSHRHERTILKNYYILPTGQLGKLSNPANCFKDIRLTGTYFSNFALMTAQKVAVV